MTLKRPRIYMMKKKTFKANSSGFLIYLSQIYVVFYAYSILLRFKVCNSKIKTDLIHTSIIIILLTKIRKAIFLISLSQGIVNLIFFPVSRSRSKRDNITA